MIFKWNLFLFLCCGRNGSLCFPLKENHFCTFKAVLDFTLNRHAFFQPAAWYSLELLWGHCTCFEAALKFCSSVQKGRAPLLLWVLLASFCTSQNKGRSPQASLPLSTLLSGAPLYRLVLKQQALTASFKKDTRGHHGGVSLISLSKFILPSKPGHCSKTTYSSP